MKKYFFFLLGAALLLAACQGYRQRHLLHEVQSKERRPPNCVLLRHNLFCDQTEVSNLDWREYEFWVKRLYGTPSPALASLQPDSTVWYSLATYGEPLRSNYYRHPAYDTYPVVGVSRPQVEAYCRWRSDRVYQSLLIRLGKIADHLAEEDSTNYFTAARYRNGQYFGHQPDLSIPVPRFRLPTEAEWELAASSPTLLPRGYTVQRLREEAKKPKKLAFYTSDLTPSAFTAGPVFGGSPNSWDIYQTVGNVAEMIAEPGVAKGGSFTHPYDSCQIDLRQTYTGPAPWLGFRCVCEWKQE